MMDRASLEPIDAQNLGSMVEHVPFVDRVNRTLRRIYGLGGGAILGLVAAISALAARELELGALQVALIAFGALLVGLGALGQITRRCGRRLRGHIEAYCLEMGLEVAQLGRMAATLPNRWWFFNHLLAQADPALTRGGQADVIED